MCIGRDTCADLVCHDRVIYMYREICRSLYVDLDVHGSVYTQIKRETYICF